VLSASRLLKLLNNIVLAIKYKTPTRNIVVMRIPIRILLRSSMGHPSVENYNKILDIFLCGIYPSFLNK
jgi:hypothetical protein